MIVIKLQGGLGNQMFQYAVARGLTKPGEPVYLDHTHLEDNCRDTEHFTARRFELEIFENIKIKKAGETQLKFFKSPLLFFKLLRAVLKPAIIKQYGNEYILLKDIAGLVYLDGYFQSEKYFRHLKKELFIDFMFPKLTEVNETFRKQIIQTPNAVSIHIRRGDYLKSQVIADVHGLLPLGYYEQAINLLRSKHPDIKLFVFSDDIAWCKIHLETDEQSIVFVSGNEGANSWQDMALMSMCRHHIVANSSFSWWGAWLSVNKGDVFAPSKWFNPANVIFNIHDFIPDNWCILNVE